jgi:hypothetical protein
MTSFDERHAAPPTVGPSAGRRVRGRPRHTAGRLTRRPHVNPDHATPDHEQAVAADASASLTEWHMMTEPEYVLAWAELHEWVTWLYGRYRLALEDRIPDCWPQHPELIEELWALRAWRTEAYGPDGSGQSAVYWHQALITFLTHVSAWWAGGCRAGHKNSNIEVDPVHLHSWATADPLAGIPQAPRPNSSIPTNPAIEPGVITMPELNTLTAAQMHALTNAGLAHPQHDTIVAFTYYDGSWWAYASHKDHSRDATANPALDQDAVWFRADDIDLACDHTFYPQPTTSA